MGSSNLLSNNFAVQTNVYRLGLITHLQAEAVPLKSVQCLRDLQRMYEAASVEDVMQAYHQIPVDDDHIFTCIGTSGPNPLPEAVRQSSMQVPFHHLAALQNICASTSRPLFEQSEALSARQKAEVA